jgi:uncharacterized membrane protein
VNRKKLLVWSAAVLAVLFAGIQLVAVEKTNPPVESDLDAPADVKEIVRRACYDCHSHETVWPWYTSVAPVSWWVTDHVNHGRADLNFSRWPLFDFEMQDHHLRDIRKQVESRRMPLPSYLRGHPEARLTDEEREILLAWATVD